MFGEEKADINKKFQPYPTEPPPPPPPPAPRQAWKFYKITRKCVKVKFKT